MSSAAFVIAVTSGCGSEAGDDNTAAANQLAEVQWLWTKLGFEAAKMVDPAYAGAVRDKYWTTLENARATLRR